MNNEINENDDFIFYNIDGEKLKVLYKLEDFLNHPQTRDILIKDWEDDFRENIEENILQMTQHNKQSQETQGTPFFKNDKGGEFDRELIKLLFNHVKPKFNLEYFYNNPEQAKCIMNDM